MTIHQTWRLPTCAQLSQAGFSFTPAADTTPPTPPGNLTGTGTSANTVQLAWQAASDNVGVTEYRVSRNGTWVATLPNTQTSYQDTGLTAFGRQVIDEMNRLGMFVDVTHTGYRTTMDVMEYTDRPVIFSHSNPKALCGHGRNITDEQIRACARTGGIIGVVGLNRFLGENRTDSERLADHVEYLIDLAGPRHVGIGLDYAFPVEIEGIDTVIADNPQFWPKNEYPAGATTYAAPAQMRELIEVLLRRGQPERTVRDVMGGNFMRLAREIWR